MNEYLNEKFIARGIESTSKIESTKVNDSDLYDLHYDDLKIPLNYYFDDENRILVELENFADFKYLNKNHKSQQQRLDEYLKLFVNNEDTKNKNQEIDKYIEELLKKRENTNENEKNESSSFIQKPITELLKCKSSFNDLLDIFGEKEEFVKEV